MKMLKRKQKALKVTKTAWYPWVSPHRILHKRQSNSSMWETTLEASYRQGLVIEVKKLPLPPSVLAVALTCLHPCLPSMCSTASQLSSLSQMNRTGTFPLMDKAPRWLRECIWNKVMWVILQAIKHFYISQNIVASRYTEGNCSIKPTRGNSYFPPWDLMLISSKRKKAKQCWWKKFWDEVWKMESKRENEWWMSKLKRGEENKWDGGRGGGGKQHKVPLLPRGIVQNWWRGWETSHTHRAPRTPISDLSLCVCNLYRQ